MKRVFSVALLLLVFGGCVTTQQNSSPPSRAEIDRYTSVRWLVTQPILRPVAAESMYVYLRIRNSAGVDVPLEEIIAADLQARGYKVTQDIEKAWYYLNVDVRHVDKGRLPDLGTIATGGSVGVPGQQRIGGVSPDSPAASRAFAQQVASSDLSMVVDIISGERVPKGTITREVSTVGAQSQTEGADGLTRGGTAGKGAGVGSGSKDTQQVTTEDVFVFYANRAVAITRLRNVDLDEALPSLSQRLGKAMASALP